MSSVSTVQRGSSTSSATPDELVDITIESTGMSMTVLWKWFSFLTEKMHSVEFSFLTLYAILILCHAFMYMCVA